MSRLPRSDVALRSARVGRPRLSDVALRSAKVGLRFRPLELAAITTAAKRQKLPVVEFVRRAALDAAAQKGRAATAASADTDALEELARRRRELLRIGTNLNQLVRAIHQGKVPADLLETVTAVRDLVNRQRAGP